MLLDERLVVAQGAIADRNVDVGGVRDIDTVALEETKRTGLGSVILIDGPEHVIGAQRAVDAVRVIRKYAPDAQLIVAPDIADLLTRLTADPESMANERLNAEEREALVTLTEHGFIVPSRAADTEALNKFFTDYREDT